MIEIGERNPAIVANGYDAFSEWVGKPGISEPADGK